MIKKRTIDDQSDGLPYIVGLYNNIVGTDKYNKKEQREKHKKVETAH